MGFLKLAYYEIDNNNVYYNDTITKKINPVIINKSVIAAKNALLYPNPVNNVANISANDVIVCVQVINILSQIVLHNDFADNGVKLKTNSLPPSSCFVKITFANRSVKDFKFVKL